MKEFLIENNQEKNFEYYKNQPKSARELLAEFEKQEQPPLGKLIKFEGTNGKDIYNITAPFEIDGEKIIAGRVESRETERDSQVCFFKEQDDAWTLKPDAPTFSMQDPFVTKIGQELILGGVKTFELEEDQQGLYYRTEFFRGENLKGLTKFAEGPPNMKDIRVLALPSGEIAVFTRPQGTIGGRGKIGFMVVPELEALATTDFLKATIIEGQFCDDEWGGANELHSLEDGRIGVVGHIGSMDSNDKKHYYAMAFIFDPQTETASPLRIIATRKNFPLTPSKRPELDDITFPTSLVRHEDKTATLYAGLSDAAAGLGNRQDPFLEIPTETSKFTSNLVTENSL